MAKKPNADDAQLILHLYELRGEPVLRAARKFMVSEFWPQNYDDLKAVLTAYGTEQNAWFRQVLTYWNMAAALVLQGALNEDLFFATNGEPYFSGPNSAITSRRREKTILTASFSSIWKLSWPGQKQKPGSRPCRRD